MAFFDITVPAGSGVGEGGSGVSAFTEPGDFDGATIDSVVIVGTPEITSDGASDDTIGIRWLIRTSLGAAVWGNTGSDTNSLCHASLGDTLPTSDPIVAGATTSPTNTPAVASDWDEIGYSANYVTNMMADAETCSWNAFTIRVTYTPSDDTTLTADPAPLTLSNGVSNFTVTLAALGAALALTGGTTAFVFGEVLAADPAPLSLTGGNATLTESGGGVFPYHLIKQTRRAWQTLITM